jgi:hypothetical protein
MAACKLMPACSNTCVGGADTGGSAACVLLAPVVCALLTLVCVRTLVGVWSVLEATRLTVGLG